MIRQLAQVVFTSPNAEQWRTFGTSILGAELAPDGPDGAVRLRLDDVAHRIEIGPGDRDDLALMVWLDDDREATEAAVAGAGVAVEDHSFTDPFGFRHHLIGELPTGPPFTPARPMGGFVTGEGGVGHVVLIVPDLAAAETFYGQVMGLRASDSIESGLSLRFFHCAGRAARHHTLALGGVPGMVGVHHLMLEVNEMDDVGRALDLVEEAGIPLANGLGRHTNDLMTSFYVRSPSGFEIEYGTGGITIDDDDWSTTVFDAQSLWGHRPPSSGGLMPGILQPFTPSVREANL